jgi:hypothetical protein
MQPLSIDKVQQWFRESPIGAVLGLSTISLIYIGIGYMMWNLLAFLNLPFTSSLSYAASGGTKAWRCSGIAAHPFPHGKAPSLPRAYAHMEPFIRGHRRPVEVWQTGTLAWTGAGSRQNGKTPSAVQV